MLRLVRIRVLAVVLVILSFNVVVLPFILAGRPQLDFQTAVVILVGGGLVTVASIIWLIQMIYRLTRAVDIAPKDVQILILACFFFGQFGMVWAVFHLTDRIRDSK